jgi:putative membrane protein
MTQYLATGQLFAKAVHVVGFVSWFAGLFYIVRLFVYHAEAAELPQPERSILERQYVVMERRLWLAITVPAMILTLVAGSALAYFYVRSSEGFGTLPWLHVKLALVAGLVVYHHICGRIRRQLAAGTCRWTGDRLRQWNEVATLLLVAIVMIAVFKSLFSALWGVIGLAAFGMALAIAVRLYRRKRERAAARPAA